MPVILTRLFILALVILLSAALLWAGRIFVARQRRLALAAEPLIVEDAQNPHSTKLRILAFGSATCSQCHTLQQPALRKLQEIRGTQIEVQEIDAPTSPELARRYHILTLPSTVLLNTDGEACAINYGFANIQKLQAQIDSILTPIRSFS